MVILVIYKDDRPAGFEGYDVENILNDMMLESFSIKTGTRIGKFPSLLDTNTKIWVPVEVGQPGDVTISNLNQGIQDSKTVDQKAYESEFFTLCKNILTLTNDPRSSDEVVPKLGFDELSTLIESYESVDFNASVKLSLKLLTVDSALKRFDPLWWDNAMYVKPDQGEQQ